MIVFAKDGQRVEVEEFDLTVLRPYYESQGWVEVFDSAAPGFDPSVHNVGEVEQYLDTADPAEVERVLDAEATGKDRVTLRKYADDQDNPES